MSTNVDPDPFEDAPFAVGVKISDIRSIGPEKLAIISDMIGESHE